MTTTMLRAGPDFARPAAPQPAAPGRAAEAGTVNAPLLQVDGVSLE